MHLGRERPLELKHGAVSGGWQRGSLCTICQSIRREEEEGLVVAVETVLWFPRSGGRVLCVHGSGSFHRRIDENR
jgi:hypothetical protein